MTDLARPHSLLLSREEERNIAVAWREKGDKRARERLVLSQLRLAEGVAKQWWRPPLCEEEIVQEGRLGLLVAVDRFDPARGCRLGTYATPWVRASSTRE